MMMKIGQLKTFSGELKLDLENRYTADGKVMPEELHDVPINMTPRNENRVPEMIVRSVDRKTEILQSGRIEQLEAENEML